MARYRLVFVPIAALIIALLSYGFASSKATAGSPAAPGGTAAGTVQDPAAQVQAPDSGAVAGAVDTSDTDTRIAFWQNRIKANPGSDAQYQYLG